MYNLERILISACLLGVSCRYDGGSKPAEGAAALMEKYELIPVCGEILGGLPTPRTPAERVGFRVLTQDGRDVTAEYEHGAREVLRLAELFDCKKAVLKERSPSCGSGKIYDGSFTGALTDGFGVTAELLAQNGIEVFGESEIEKLL